MHHAAGQQREAYDRFVHNFPSIGIPCPQEKREKIPLGRLFLSVKPNVDKPAAD